MTAQRHACSLPAANPGRARLNKSILPASRNHSLPRRRAAKALKCSRHVACRLLLIVIIIACRPLSCSSSPAVGRRSSTCVGHRVKNGAFMFRLSSEFVRFRDMTCSCKRPGLVATSLLKLWAASLQCQGRRGRATMTTTSGSLAGHCFHVQWRPTPEEELGFFLVSTPAPVGATGAGWLVARPMMVPRRRAEHLTCSALCLPHCKRCAPFGSVP